MPPANNSNFVTWKMLTVIVGIGIVVIGGIATLSTTADAKIEKAVEKLDEDKVEKDVFEMYIKSQERYMKTQETYRLERKEQWKEVNGKLNKALGIE